MLKVWVGLEARSLVQASIEDVCSPHPFLPLEVSYSLVPASSYTVSFLLFLACLQATGNPFHVKLFLSALDVPVRRCLARPIHFSVPSHDCAAEAMQRPTE